MLRAVHWHQTWGIVVSWLWKRLSVHWAWGSSFKHELPGNPRVSGCLNRTVGKVIIGGFNLDKGRLSRCYREISYQTVPSCPLMLFQAHNKRRELEETWQNEEDTVVVQKHPGTEKLLPLCEAKSHKAVHAPFTIAITQQSGLSCFVNTTVKQKVWGTAQLLGSVMLGLLRLLEKYLSDLCSCQLYSFKVKMLQHTFTLKLIKGSLVAPATVQFIIIWCWTCFNSSG